MSYRSMEPPAGVEPALLAYRANDLAAGDGIGADDANRTRIPSLEGWNSTVELHPQEASCQGEARTLNHRLNRALHHRLCYLASTFFGTPNGTRTRVTGLKGQRPRPLDDGSLWWSLRDSNPERQIRSLL